MKKVFRWRRAWTITVAGLAFGSVAPPPTAASGGAAAIAVDLVERAKEGLVWFLAEHFTRPTVIEDPCPLLRAESLGWYLGQVGLVASQRDFGVAVARLRNVVPPPAASGFAPPAVIPPGDDGEGGGGGSPPAGTSLLAARCGVDVSASPNPNESTSVSIDAVVLDGVVRFDQYAVWLAGRDVVIAAIYAPVGELAGRCRNGGRTCEYALNVDGLVITVRTNGPAADATEIQTRQLLATMTPEIVTNLASLAEQW